VSPTSPSTTWSFLLDELCEVQGIDHAVALSGDGLVMAASSQLDPDHADQAAAITSGLASLTNGACRLMNAGEVESTVVDMTGGVMIVMAINERSILTVLADKQAELGQVVYEMDMLIKRAGELFIPLERKVAVSRI
jgi:predicted regulator of Ras-like GTPase activity (Roadblock/LC7/MglB family)